MMTPEEHIKRLQDALTGLLDELGMLSSPHDLDGLVGDLEAIELRHLLSFGGGAT